MEWGWLRVKIHICPNLGMGLPRGKNRKNCSFWANRWRIQKCVTYSKINELGQLGREVRGVSGFLTLKKSCYPPISPSIRFENLKFYVHCTHSKSHRSSFWEFQLFSLFAPPHRTDKVVFVRFFFFFSNSSTRISSSTQVERLKWAM